MASKKCLNSLALFENLGLHPTVEKLDIAFNDPVNLSADLCKIQNRYAFQGAYRTQNAPTLFIDGKDMGTLDNLKVPEIIALAEPSPFGLGTKTVYDENVRKACEIKGDRINVTLDLPDEVQGMAPMGYKIVSKLYKLAIYEKDGFFAEHADTLHGENHIGTLVVCLPVPHEGGAFILTDEGNKLVLPFDDMIKDNKIPWVAFYTDVKHKVEVVKSGIRMTIQYDLTVEKKTVQEEKNLTAKLEGNNIKEPNNRYRFQDYNGEIMTVIQKKLKEIFGELDPHEEEKCDENDENDEENDEENEEDEEKFEEEEEEEEEYDSGEENEATRKRDEEEAIALEKRIKLKYSHPDGVAIMLKRRYGASTLALDKLKGTDSALYEALKDRFTVEVKQIILEHRTNAKGTYRKRPIEVVAINKLNEKQENCSSEEETEVAEANKKHVPEHCKQPENRRRKYKTEIKFNYVGEEKLVCLVSGLSPQALAQLVNQQYIECTGNEAMEGVNSYIHAALFIYPKKTV